MRVGEFEACCASHSSRTTTARITGSRATRTPASLACSVVLATS